jgi:hypothetical protein
MPFRQPGWDGQTVPEGPESSSLGISRVTYYSFGIDGARETWRFDMWQPWTWSRSSNDRAIGNARTASTVLGRQRVEREQVALFLEERCAPVAAVGRPA